MSTETYQGCTFRYVHDPVTPGRIRIYLEGAPGYDAMLARPAVFGLEQCGSQAPPYLSFVSGEAPGNITDAKRRAQAWATARSAPAPGSQNRAAGTSLHNAARPLRNTNSRPASTTLTDLSAVRLASPHGPSSDEIFTALTGRVRGQDTALRVVANAVAGHLAKPAPRRPLSMFMVGPTGVGKTMTVGSLAESLAESHCHDGSGRRFLCLDMAEYQEAYRVSQLFGAPPGYVGYTEGAILTGFLRANPNGIVLLDEIEKAHPSVFVALMGAIENGRLSVPAGIDGQHQIDCRRAVFCFTSNLRCGAITEALQQQGVMADAPEADACIRRELRGSQLPDALIGRISRCIAFQPLPPEALLEAVVLGIRDLAHEYGLNLQRIDPIAVSALASQTETVFGARTQLYELERRLGNVFAEAARAPSSQAVELCGPPFRLVSSRAATAIYASQ